MSVEVRGGTVSKVGPALRARDGSRRRRQPEMVGESAGQRLYQMGRKCGKGR